MARSSAAASAISARRILFEPGRVFVGNAGILVAEVVYVKQGAAKTFVILDAGMNDLIRPTLYEAHHDIRPVRQPDPNAEPIVADVVGGICETGDYLALDRRLPPLEVRRSGGDHDRRRLRRRAGLDLQHPAAGRRGPGQRRAIGPMVRPRQTYDDLIGMDRVAPWLA